ncbi:hypothetical protein Tco_1105916 [Tanacetum coccineum]
MTRHTRHLKLEVCVDLLLCEVIEVCVDLLHYEVIEMCVDLIHYEFIKVCVDLLHCEVNSLRDMARQRKRLGAGESRPAESRPTKSRPRASEGQSNDIPNPNNSTIQSKKMPIHD